MMRLFYHFIKAMAAVSSVLIWGAIAATGVAAQVFWEQPAESRLGIVLSLAIDAHGQVFAGTPTGVFSSNNDGNTWMPVGASSLKYAITALTIKTGNQVFAGTSENGIYRFNTYDSSWAPVNAGLTNRKILSLAIDPLTQDLWAGTRDGGVFLLANQDSSVWTTAGLAGESVWSLAINKRGQIFAGTSNGVFNRSNKVGSWMPKGLEGTIIISLAIDPSTPDIFAGASGGGVFRSTNDSNTWIPISEGLTNKVIRSLAINTNGYVFAGTNGSGVFRLIKNESAWAKINTGLTDSTIFALSINSQVSERVFAGTRGGAFRSVDAKLPWLASTLPDSQQQRAQNVDIAAIIHDDIGVRQVSLYYRRGGRANFQPVVMAETPPNSNRFRGEIPSDSVTSCGVEYYIRAGDVFENTNRFPAISIVSIQIRVDGEGEIKRDAQGKSLAQPSGSDQNAYRLFSVPLDVDDKSPKAVLEDDLGRYDKKKWRFYALRDDYYSVPMGASIYTEFLNTEEMKPGKAFWLIVKDSSKVIDTGPAVSNKTDKEYVIALHSGWNFIGNPFNFSIPVEKLRLKSRGKPPTLRYFSGEWTNVTANPVRKILPFEGYAVFDSTFPGDTLFVNPDLSASSSQLLKQTTLQRENALFSIQILAQCQEARDVDNVVTVAADASRNQDDLDQPEPPVIGEYVSVYFPHRDWQTLAKTYCLDARPEPTEGEVWEFEVKTNIRDKVNLTFEGLDEVLPELEVWLVDDALKITQNLRESNHYAVAGSEQPKQLKLVVGKRDFVGEKLAEAQAIPTTYELSQNFPNPFNPSTTIRYGLPKAERVTLKIYNLLGEEVVTLVNDEQQAAGYHAAIWDGRNKNGVVVASGIYVYRIRARRFAMAKKLSLIR